MRTFDLIGFEWKLQFRHGFSFLLLAAFASALIYGSLAGKAERDERVAAIGKHHLQIESGMEGWLHDLRELESSGPSADLPPWAGSAMDVTFATSLPQAPLADFAVGQSDLLPYAGAVSLWDPDIRLFSKYEFADPVSLALGSFDISKAVILFLPLILVVFCFDAIAADRDANRLGLTVAQGLSIKRLLWQRLAFRASIVLLVTLVTALLALVIGTGEEGLAARLPAFGLWSLFLLEYAAFWLMLIAFVASFNRSSEFNVLALFGLWVGFTLVIPSATSAVAEVIYPTASRLAYLADARQVENETRLQESDVANQFMLDHPELLVNQESLIPAFVLSSFLVTSTVDAATQPVVESFEDAMQRRERVMGLFRYLSPAVAAHSLFNELAGTSGKRHQAYLTQARQFKADYAKLVGPNIVAKQPINSQFYQAIPKFQFQDEPLASRLGQGLGPVALLFLLSVGMGHAANRRLQSASPISA